jgi:ethanolamine permease
MGYSRQIYALARAGFLPTVLAQLGERRRTPHWAILAGGVIGVAAIYSDRWVQIGGQPLTANIVTLSVFGAVVLYLISMLALLRLRRTEPALERPFRAPCYPWFPLVALLTAFVCLVTMVFYNAVLFAIFVGLFVLAAAYYYGVVRRRIARAPAGAFTGRR